MFITVCLDNYNTLPDTIIFVLLNEIARTSISVCLVCILDNTLTGKTLDEKIFGTDNSLKRKLKFSREKTSQEKYFEGIREVTNIRNEKFSN